MTHPFSNSVVEAAAKAVMDSDGCTRDGICEKCKEVAVVAISAAFQQARVEGLVRDGAECPACQSAGIRHCSDASNCGQNFPVIIIRKETP